MTDQNGYTVVMPKLGLIMTEARLVDWYKNEGERVEKGDILFTMESEKTTLEIEAPASGDLHILVAAGETVPVQTPIAVIAPQVIRSNHAAGPSPASIKVEKQALTATAVDQQAAAPPQTHGMRITPKARRMAQRLGVELEGVSGSGPRGMIVAEDVEKAASRATRPATAAQPTAAAAPLPLNGLRAVIAERLSASWREKPQVTLVTDADASRLVKVRSKIAEESGQKISYNAFILLAAARALKSHSYINVRLSDKGLEQPGEIHIGFAVDSERGLLVPVVRHADHKSLAAIDQELRRLAGRAQAGSILPDELSGGTFTITNLGAYGIDAFTPIINPPETAILGVGRIAPRPVVHEGQLIARETVTLSLSFDHRLVDGAPAARFLERIVYHLERPLGLLAEVQAQ